MDTRIERTSRYYGTSQTLLLLGYAGAFLLDREAPLFGSELTAFVGSTLCLVGLMLLMLAIFWLRRVVQVSPEPKAGGQLVQAGIYKYLRHPIYTGIVITVVGLFLKKPMILAGLASVVVVVFLLVKVRFEERRLLAAYPEYAAYRGRTWGIIPGWRG